jgi:undecaprenyl-diphosphatase
MTQHMHLWEAVILGIVEGLTEFLPISSTGHLTIVEKAMGFKVDDKGVTAFTAIIQGGAIVATLIYFRDDVIRILRALAQGLTHARSRDTQDFRFGIAVAVGCIPIAIVGLAFKDQIETTLRSLWFVAFALIAWSGVMHYADRRATQVRHEEDVTLKDTFIIGLVQCIALIPGVSRSGATMSGGLLRGIDRVAVTRLSFFLAIPALGAATLLQAATEYDKIASGVGWGSTLVATVVSFAFAYLSIAWLLRYVARHDFTVFVIYRVALGVVLAGLLVTGVLDAT